MQGKISPVYEALPSVGQRQAVELWGSYHCVALSIPLRTPLQATVGSMGVGSHDGTPWRASQLFKTERRFAAYDG